MADESFQSIPYRLLSAETKAVVDANAKASGMASGEEYLKSRGGVNVSGYYGDSYVAGRTLTDQEYIDVLTKAKKEGKTGTLSGAEINIATQQKAVNYYLNNPSAIPNESLRNEYSSGQINKSQLEQLLKAGYADARGLEVLQAINTIKSGGTLKKAPVGVTQDGKLFYGYDAQGKPILQSSSGNSSTGVSSLQAGEALGKFTKLPSGLWQIGDGGETTSGIGFARLLARKGFDATRLPVGATLQIQPTGEVVYQGKTYLNTNPTVIKAIEDRVNKAAQAGVLAGATGQGLGRIVGGFSSSDPRDYVGMKISDVFAPESWPPGYKWDSPIPPEGIPQSRSSHVLPITKEVLGPYYESYAREYGAGGTIDFGVGNIPQENMPYYGDGSTQNMPYYGAGATRPFITSSGATLTGEEYNKRVNAMSSLTALFERYGLGSLAPTIKNLAMEGAGDDTITLRLMESQEYQDRFSANKDRLKKGLSALTPGEYLRLEDGYRQVLRAYGLKAFDNDAYVKQFISNDVSPDELSNRVVTAVQRVQNADPAVMTTLRDYYGIGNNDLVAYVLDPNQQFQKIERQVAAAEIGTAARLQGIEAGSAVSEQLAAQGITKAQAQKGYSTIADILPTAEKLSDIYGKTLEQYRLPEAEQEVFNSLASAQRKRRALTEREIAAFGGSSGLGKTALDQGTRGNF